MRLPFTLEQFLDVFHQYNESIGLAPPLLTILAASAAGLAFTGHAWRHRVIAGTLAALWLWSGVVYHWTFFTRINAAAWLFGALFVVQAFLLLVYGVVRGRIRFLPAGDVSSAAGFVLILYALAGYPALGWMLGHGYPNGPSFGAPCPITIYFLGMTLWAIESVPARLVVVPIGWAAVGTGAALQLGIREDLGLAVGGLAVLIELARHRRGRRAGSAAPPGERLRARPA